jgi:uncharacterized membrane protein YcjF (UPF0283 family)
MKDKSRAPGVVSDEAVALDDEGNIGSAKAAEREPVRRPHGLVTDDAVSLESNSIKQAVVVSDVETRHFSAWKVSFYLGLAFLITWAFVGGVIFLHDLIQQNQILGLLVGVLLLSLCASLVYGVFTELRAWKLIGSSTLTGNNLVAAWEENDFILAKDTLEPILCEIAQHSPDIVAEFHGASASRESARDYLELFDNVVLASLDQQASKLIKQSVLATGFGVAAIPHPALDSMFVMWRALRLVRGIGEVYGVPSTGVSSIRLLTYCLNSAFIAALVGQSFDTLSDFLLLDDGEGVATLGAEAVGAKVGKVLAEGAVTSVRMYRLGKNARLVCRPWCRSLQVGVS